MKSRWGEISRISYHDFWIIITTSKGDIYNQMDAVWFDIFLSNKSSKNRKYATKRDRKYSFGDGDFLAIRLIERVIKEYLDRWSPTYLAIAAFEGDNDPNSNDSWIKRFNVYIKSLKRMGYVATDSLYKGSYSMNDIVVFEKMNEKPFIVRVGKDSDGYRFYEFSNGRKETVEWMQKSVKWSI